MKKTKEYIIFNVFAVLFTTIFAVLCIIPMLYTISGSFTAERYLFKGLKLIPPVFSTQAYGLVLKNPTDMLNAYKVTIALVLIGTFFSLLITSMTSYVLYRTDFAYRNMFSFFFFFTTLFSGGLVPIYILICRLGLKNTFWVLVLPQLLSVFNVIVMRTYFTGNIPSAFVESAKIDGAGDFLIYYKIILPVSKPILATIGLLVALGYWNDWSHAMLYITNKKYYPLQYYLYQIFNSITWQQQIAENTGNSTQQMPQEGFKLAMTVFTIGPVVLFYPFVQRYFVSGLTIGAVKG